MRKELTTIRIDADLKQRLKKRDKDENESYSALIRELLEENFYLSNNRLLALIREEFDIIQTLLRIKKEVKNNK